MVMEEIAELTTHKPKLTFAELESAACFGTSGFLTLNFARIAGDEAFGTQYGFVLSIDFNQSAGYGQAQCLRLAGEAATAEVYFDVIFFGHTQLVQRLFDDVLQNA